MIAVFQILIRLSRMLDLGDSFGAFICSIFELIIIVSGLIDLIIVVLLVFDDFLVVVAAFCGLRHVVVHGSGTSRWV